MIIPLFYKLIYSHQNETQSRNGRYAVAVDLGDDNLIAQQRLTVGEPDSFSQASRAVEKLGVYLVKNGRL